MPEYEIVTYQTSKGQWVAQVIMDDDFCDPVAWESEPFDSEESARQVAYDWLAENS